MKLKRHNFRTNSIQTITKTLSTSLKDFYPSKLLLQQSYSALSSSSSVFCFMNNQNEKITFTPITHPKHTTQRCKGIVRVHVHLEDSEKDNDTK